jgi:hypothetical protein
VVRLLRLLRQGDLGMLDSAWTGFRVEHDVLVTPDGRTFTAASLRLWWSTVEQARFWRQAYDRTHAATGCAEHPADEAPQTGAP